MKVDIYAALRECYTIASKHCGDGTLMGVFLRGSQNYGLEGPESDIDCIAIVIPTLDEVAMDKDKISKTVESPYGLITVQDIRIVFKNLIKQKPNMLEILFTRYAVVPTDYRKFYQMMCDKALDLCRADVQMLMAACLGILKQYCTSIGKDKGNELYEHLGYNPKMLANAFRVWSFIKEYCSFRDYRVAMLCCHPQSFFEFKYGVACNNLDEARDLCNHWYAESLERVSKYESEHLTKDGVYKDIVTLHNFYQICVSIMRYAWDGEFNQGGE